ncbi:hypothetical protein K502DRAFT_353228 [Neoconidiobolus thromboides FSU 785]|nr:hypothetical protein K502DRAFT_353228 [Neoconidiobolus thromboides FSU 785]
MWQSQTIIQTRIRSACDECHRTKRGCDLTIPSCSGCKEKEVVCTRDRKIKRKPRMYNNEDFHSKTFLLSRSTRTKREERVEGEVILNHKYFSQFIISSNGARVNSNNSIGSFFPIKLFHSPAVLDENLYSIYKFAPNQSLSLFFDKLPSIESKFSIVKGSINVYNTMSQLITIYFQRINIILPLFTYNQFISKERDKILIYSMMLVALARSKDRKNLLDFEIFLKNKLLNYFKPSRLKINLSSIQTMIILLNGLKGSSLALPSYYFSNLHNHCILLGLHLNHKNDIERMLCYSAAVYLLSVDDPYSTLLFDTHDLWKKEKTILKLSENESVEVIMQLIISIYSNYCYKCGLYYKHYFDPLLHINVLNITNEKTIKFNPLLQKLLDSITERVVSKLEAIKQDVSNKVVGNIINILIDHIKIIYYSNWVELYCIKWAALDSDKEDLFIDFSLNKEPKDLSILEKNIQLFIIHNHNLKSKYYSSTRFFAYLLIIFCIKIYSKWMPNASELLNQVLDQFNKLSKDINPSIKSVINLIVQFAKKD